MTDQALIYRTTCYGNPITDYHTEAAAKAELTEHIQVSCPSGAMPWAAGIKWHRIDDVHPVTGTATPPGWVTAANGEWLNHGIEEVQGQPALSPSAPVYDSRVDTLVHSQRVAELMMPLIHELLDRSTCHDRSKTLPPEVEVFDTFTPKLKTTTYGSEEYKGHLAAMGPALRHHYAYNRHHPEHHSGGINGMTLVDLIEMLADWKAATERHDDGSLETSLGIQQQRFGITPQLHQILRNTALFYGWLGRQARPCGAGKVYAGEEEHTCSVLLDGDDWHWGPHVDARWHGGQLTWWGPGAKPRE